MNPFRRNKDKNPLNTIYQKLKKLGLNSEELEALKNQASKDAQTRVEAFKERHSRVLRPKHTKPFR